MLLTGDAQGYAVCTMLICACYGRVLNDMQGHMHNLHTMLICTMLEYANLMWMRSTCLSCSVWQSTCICVQLGWAVQWKGYPMC